LAGLSEQQTPAPRSPGPARAWPSGLPSAWPTRAAGGLWRAVVHPFDRLDERRARGRREAFGRRARLLSWAPGPDGLWTARLSAPGVRTTIERSARTRCGAIDRAARVLDRIVEVRDRLGPRPDPGARPDPAESS